MGDERVSATGAEFVPRHPCMWHLLVQAASEFPVTGTWMIELYSFKWPRFAPIAFSQI